MTGQLSQEAGEATFLETDILRKQDLQACEIAYQALQENNSVTLRWFTVQVLKYRDPWTSMVCLALIDQDKEGVLRWRTARKPLALLKLIAWCSAAKWEPHLRGLRPHRRHEELMSDVIGREGHYSESMDRLVHKRLGDEEYDELWDLDEDLVVDEIQVIHGLDGQFFRIGLQYSWREIGRRMDWEADETTMIEARALGFTRRDMPRHLGWTQTKCETVWRRSSRRISQSAMKARTRLLQHTENATRSSTESDA